MKEYIYPTRTNQGDEWAKRMLDDWRKSGKRHLCFPWIRTQVHTLPNEPFWMYLYYSFSESDIPQLIGKFEYRIRIIEWSLSRYQGDNIYRARYNEDGKVWFLCDGYEEIRNMDHKFIGLEDFKHAFGKKLISSMRSSIPPVVCLAKIFITDCYPKSN